jgi:hypothetical protein
MRLSLQFHAKPEEVRLLWWSRQQEEEFNLVTLGSIGSEPVPGSIMVPYGCTVYNNLQPKICQVTKIV